MKKKIFYNGFLFLILISCFHTFQNSFAVGTPQIPLDQKHDYTISSWLILGPHTFYYPAFSKEEKNGMEIKDFLLFEEINVASLKPAESVSIEWLTGKNAKWKKNSSTEGTIELPVD